MLERWVVMIALAATPVVASAQRALVIAGAVYEDRPALALRTSLLQLTGVTVRLYRDGGDGAPTADDALIATTTTKDQGVYAFRVDSTGTFWVTVDSRTIHKTAWPEQTLGAAGSLCARPDGTTVSIGALGPCFGGRTFNSDDASSLATSEHIAKVSLDGPLSNVDFAFSFDVVTSVADGERIQGSFRQFLLNANAVAGPNRMRFVPLTPAPEQRDPTMGTPQHWWSITFASPLPPSSDEDTFLDGVARNFLSPTSVANVNPGRVGDSPRILPEDLAADRIQKPDLELIVTGEEGIVCTARCAMRDFAVRGAPVAIVTRADARIEHLLIGASPDAAPAAPRGIVGLQVERGLTIAHNVLVTAQTNIGIAVTQQGRLEGSHLDVSRCGEPSKGGGIVLLSDGSEIHSSIVTANPGGGVVLGAPDGSRPVSGNRVDGTTISSNEAGVVLSPGSSRNIITRNDIMWNRLGGVTVAPWGDAPPRENRISANRYDENGRRPIVLNLEAEPDSLARAGSCERVVAAPNAGISAPVIMSAELGGEEDNLRVTIRGRACPGEVVEIYQSFTTSSVREKKSVEMPRIRGERDEVETLTHSEREMSLPSIGEFNYVGAANTAADGTFEALFPFTVVKPTTKPAKEVERETDVWAREVLLGAAPGDRAYSGVSIDSAGNTSEMSVRRRVEKQVAETEK